ncbi:DoxX family membrane protein [Paenibacillus radicis (ex Xue et al. 2023)]|uniref:DoxX family protein n=1 Tax=Paenibacillus radicis (ex Xue et al. 2023) TaxID=2972489 RepID=A0ABT1YQQ9_9BACL|nr:DoxX family membrane protein [Paenibacillus radicis (ex Xue et al. 2023)]MCR8635511.1 hypothetical protein [Paenibacillus radicis (ex Xue et al. 2023)]
MFEISVTIVRILLGMIFIAGAVNGFLIQAGKQPFMPVNQKATGFLIDTGYLYPLVKATEMTAGVLLLFGWFVPAAILLIGPVVVNIFWMHLLHDKPLIWVGALLLALVLYLAFAYRYSFLPLFYANMPNDHSYVISQPNTEGSQQQ